MQNSPAFLGGVAGEAGTTVTRAAVAQRIAGGVAECGLCVLGTGTPFTGQNGNIHVRGDAGASINGSATTGPNGCLSVESGSIVLHSGGTSSGDFGGATACDDNVVTNTTTRVAFPLANPLAHLDALEPAPGSPKSGCNQGPGTYVQIPTNCILAPGLYIITGSNHPSGQEWISGQGVTLFFRQGADLICTGQTEFSITAPATSPGQGVPPGISIWFASNNTGSFDCRGNGAGVLQGTIYGARMTLIERGNGSCTTDGLVVIGVFDMRGNNARCTINYESNENVEIPWGDPFLAE